MSGETLTIGDVEITAILDVDTSIPLAEVFDGSSDPPPGGSGSLAARYPDDFTADGWHFRAHCFLVRTPTRLTLIDRASARPTRPSGDGSASLGRCRTNWPCSM